MNFSSCSDVDLEPQEDEDKKDEDKKDEDKKDEDKKDDGIIDPLAGLSIIYDSTISGIGSASAVAVGSNRLYVAQSSNHQISIYTNLSGTPALETTLGTGSASTNNQGGFNFPTGVSVFDNKLCVADNENHRVVVYTNLSSGSPTYARHIGITGRTNLPGLSSSSSLLPTPIGVLASGSKVYVAGVRNTVLIYTWSGDRLIGDQAISGLRNPYSVARANDKLFIADLGNSRVQIYTNLSRSTPTYLGTITGFSFPSGVAAFYNKLYVADAYGYVVKIYDISGAPVLEATLGTGGVKTDDTGFNEPYGVAAYGKKLYVADTANNRVQIYEWR